MGLDLDILEIIAKDNERIEDCLQEVLNKWLKLTPNATWRTLEVALTNVRRLQLGLNPVYRLNYGETKVLTVINYVYLLILCSLYLKT